MCKQQNRERRLARYQALRSLLDVGMKHSEASRHLRLPLRTVQRWLAYGVFQERKHRVYPSIVDAYGPYLESRNRDSCRNINQLSQEVQKIGFEGQASLFATGCGSASALPNSRGRTHLRSNLFLCRLSASRG